MTTFQDAIRIASQNAEELLKQATKFEVEEAILSDDGKRYEVTLSYELKGKDPLSVGSSAKNTQGPGLMELARLMTYRKQYKTFFVDKKTGTFTGFKIRKQA